MEKKYIGDGVYMVIEFGAVVLTTENGVRATNRIVLEPEVLEAMLEALKKELPRVPKEWYPFSCGCKARWNSAENGMEFLPCSNHPTERSEFKNVNG